MGDGIKIHKDKRHRSSSSLAGVDLEGTRSERKLDIRTSIAEVDDQFAIAEARCGDLQEKIEMVKVLKRKRKQKKRSMTRLNDQSTTAEPVPFITVRTQPKKKVSQQAARLCRLEVPPNPTRGYLDPATVEQHRMIGQMHGYNQMLKQPQEQIRYNQSSSAQRTSGRGPSHRTHHANGDCANIPKKVYGSVSIDNDTQPGLIYGEDAEFSENDDIFQQLDAFPQTNKKYPEIRQNKKITPTARSNRVQRDLTRKADEKIEEKKQWQAAESSPVLRRRNTNRQQQNIVAAQAQVDERPVVELFSKVGNYTAHTPEVRQSAVPVDTKQTKNKKGRDAQRFNDEVTGNLQVLTPPASKKECHKHPRRVKYRSRRYELPTVASQMKQAGMRYYYGTANNTNIPFVVSKSTAPSHNIGVNIQQVLNGLKIQQPLSGIPLTIAHHMGLGHVPTYGTKSAPLHPSLDSQEINAIRMGRRLVRLPSYKYISFNRLLSMYREGDGMVPRFLRAISRPHYFYTSMYNLATHREDFDGATSKGRSGNQEAKQSLAEYANLYREYEQVEKCIKEGNYEPELERRKEELSRELAAREEHIRRVVQEYRTGPEVDLSALRASASTTEEPYRHSTFKLNSGDPQQ